MYANGYYMETGSAYPKGADGNNMAFSKIIVLEDATFSKFTGSWKIGNTDNMVTETQISALSANIYPCTITDLTVTAGKIVLFDF